MHRWWIYQRERFPLLAHGLLIAAFSFSAVCFSALLRGSSDLPAWQSVVVAFATAFIFFLQLRIADEFKDFEEDARWRPYRPVPRGLVALRELAVVFVLGCLIQLALALWLHPGLILLLTITWTYLALMSKEFFVRAWLQHRHVLYMVSHMAIIPLVDFYATACDWRPAGETPPLALYWFVAVSYFNGLVIEIGRKVRTPHEEEEGVNTYSRLWGPRHASLVWLGAMTATAILASIAAWHIDFLVPVLVVLSSMLVCAGATVAKFQRDVANARGKRIETVAGLWTLCLYLVLGAVPMFVRWWTLAGASG